MTQQPGSITPQRAEGRLKWVDTVKAMGIFLVFLGHASWLRESLTVYIYSFHIPLFFFLSGMFFKDAVLGQSFLRFARTKVRTRLVPYIFFGLVSYAVWLVLMLYLISQGKPPHQPLWKPLAGMVYGNGIDGWLAHNTLLWFLACLLVTELVFFALRKFTADVKIILALLLLASLLGFWGSAAQWPRLPFGMNVALTALVFYGLGYVGKDFIKKADIGWILLVLILAVHFILAMSNGRVDMNENRLNNYFLFYINALLGIWAWTQLAGKIRSMDWVRFIGENTLVLFCLQSTSTMVLFALWSVLPVPDRVKDPNTLFAVIFTLLSLTLLIPAVLFIRRHLPFVLGGSRK